MAKRRTLGETVARQAHEIEGYKTQVSKLHDDLGKLRGAFEAADEERSRLRGELEGAMMTALERKAQIDILLTVIRTLR